MRTHPTHAGPPLPGNPVQALRARRRYLATPAKPSVMVPEVPHEQIAQRAYELYLAREGRDGDDLSDWFAAERELKSAAAILPALPERPDQDLPH